MLVEKILMRIHGPFFSRDGNWEVMDLQMLPEAASVAPPGSFQEMIRLP